MNNWPPLLGGWRYRHATVVLNHPDKVNAQTVVVLGGYRHHGTTNSVLVLNLDEENKQWQAATPMNQSRWGHAAVVCNGGVYVIGGRNEVHSSTVSNGLMLETFWKRRGQTCLRTNGQH